MAAKAEGLSVSSRLERLLYFVTRLSSGDGPKVRIGHEPALRTALFLTLPCHAILHRSRGMYINRYSRISPKITPLIANAPH